MRSGGKMKDNYNANIIDKNKIIKSIEKLSPSIISMLRGIREDDIVIDTNTNSAMIYVMGDFFVEVLNEKGSEELSKIYKKENDIEVTFAFSGHEGKYNRVKKEIEETVERNNIREALEREEIKKKKEEFEESYSQRNDENDWKRNNYKAKRKSKIVLAEVKEANTKFLLKELSKAAENITIEGFVFKMSSFVTKRGSYLLSMYVSDDESSINSKVFLEEKEKAKFDKEIKENDWIRAIGNVEWDNYDRSFTFMIKKIMKIPSKGRCDIAEEKRVELHAHTKMSKMDGVNDVSVLINTAKEWGHKAIAITDHGVVQAYPEAYKVAKGIKVIYGMEGYLIDDIHSKNDDGTINYKEGKTNHIIILAKNQIGIKNMYKLVSFSHLNYFHRSPRIPKSILEKHREGLILGSACEAGELYSAILNRKTQEEIEKIASFYDYLEIQPLSNNRFMIRNNTVKSEEDLKEINRQIVTLGEKLNIPVVATCDTHYLNKEDNKYREILMVGMDYKDAEFSSDLYFRTTDEMLDEFSYLGKEKAYEVVISNTNKIAEMTDNVSPLKEGKFPPKIEGAEIELKVTCEEKAKEIYGDPLPEKIRERLERELSSIIGNHYAVMYISAKKLVDKSMEDGYLVASRGSVGSSFAATMAGITEVNPLPPHYICPHCKYLEWGDEIKYECGVDMPEKDCPKCNTVLNKDGYYIRFETFLGFEGDKEPDIDLNFAGEYQSKAHKYVEEIFGAENVFRAGTIGTIAEKTAYGFTKKYMEEKGVPDNKIEVERLTRGCVGVRRTTGQHPGGIIIVPRGREIYEFCPVNYPANNGADNIITTHFDYHSIDSNLLKLDILGHDVPSMIRWLELMTGIGPFEINLSDKKTFGLFLGVDSLDIKIKDYKFTHGSYGIPEFGTKFVRQMLDDIKPKNMGDLVKISGLSHGTDVWINNAQEYIRNGTATADSIICTRDDIMDYLILQGLANKQAFDIMEKVRKGKGLTKEEEEIMRAHNVPEWYIDSCKKIKYMFPRAHAVAYVVMAYRMAYFKIYYPIAFYAVYLTTKLADFNWDVVRKGIYDVENRMNELIGKGREKTKKEEDEITVLEICYEMYARGYEFKSPTLDESLPAKFIESDGKVMVPLCALQDVGEKAGNLIYEEHRLKPFTTVEDISKRGKVSKNSIAAMRDNGMLDDLPETDQLMFF